MGRLDDARPWLKIVGIAADTKIIPYPYDTDVDGALFLPLPQLLALSTSYTDFTFVLEAAGDPRALEPSLRVALARADPRLTAYEVDTLTDAAAATRTTERFALVLVSLFGVLGLVLSAIGLYGLLSVQVERRTREFGIRSALGATADGLARMVTGQGFRLLATGLLFGAVLAWAGLHVAARRWPNLPETGPLPYLGAGAVLAVAILLACWIPSRRAAQVDPLIALRAE